MSEEARNELKNLLKNVSDSYDDFVIGALALVDNCGATAGQVLLEYLKTHKEADTSEIIDWEYYNIITKFPSLVE